MQRRLSLIRGDASAAFPQEDDAGESNDSNERTRSRKDPIGSRVVVAGDRELHESKNDECRLTLTVHQARPFKPEQSDLPSGVNFQLAGHARKLSAYATTGWVRSRHP